MTQHTQFADELTRYLLGELSETERAELEQHLGRCGDCRAELQNLRAAAALVTLAAPQVAPPPRSKARLMAAIEREPRMAVVHQSGRTRPWWIWVPSVAALALALVAGLLWRENMDLREESQQMTSLVAQQELDAQHTKEMMVDISAPGATRMNVVEAGSKPQAHGKAVYNPKDGGVVFMASNLSQLPPGQTYQLWIVPVAGGTPISAGTFQPNAHGAAVVMKHGIAKSRPGLFAVTVEDKAGMKELSSPVVMVSEGE